MPDTPAGTPQTPPSVPRPGVRPLNSWSFHAVGDPAPQGSKRHIGRGIMVESSKRLRPWRDTITAAAVGAGPQLDGPLAAAMIFTVPRPASAKRDQVVPDKFPDVSKAARAAEDAITDAGLWTDDARVAFYHPQAKVYPNLDYPGVEGALPVPGVVIACVSIQPHIQEPDLADVDQSAAALGISKAALLRIAGGRYGVTRANVDMWLGLQLDDPEWLNREKAAAKFDAAERKAAVAAERNKPPTVPDPRAQLAALVAAEVAAARTANQRWQKAG